MFRRYLFDVGDISWETDIARLSAGRAAQGGAPSHQCGQGGEHHTPRKMSLVITHVGKTDGKDTTILHRRSLAECQVHQREL